MLTGLDERALGREDEGQGEVIVVFTTFSIASGDRASASLNFTCVCSLTGEYLGIQTKNDFYEQIFLIHFRRTVP